MINTTTSFHIKAKGQVINPIVKLYVSFEKEKREDVTFFKLDDSVLDGVDILKSSEDNPIQLWDTYTYYDFSDRIINASVQRSIEFPYNTQCALCDITLNNYDGYFNPSNTSSSIYGYNIPKRPLKIYAGYGGETVIPQFVGVTQELPDISLPSGTAKYHTIDFLSEIANQTLNETISMKNVSTDKVLAKIVEQFGVLQSQYNFETGSNVIPFVFFEKGNNAGDVIKKLLQAENGKFWLDETGILKFSKRSSILENPVISLDDYSIISVEPSGYSDIINHVKITCDLREVQEFQTIYTKKSSGDNISDLWVIDAGQSITRECRLEDPCYDVVLPVQNKNSGVSWFTAKKTDGTIVSSNISVSGELTTNSYILTFTNENDYAIEIDEIQLWGEPAKVYDVLDYDVYDDESVEKNGEHILEITNNEFFQSYSQAQSFGVYVLREKANYNSTLKMRIKGDFSLQLGDCFELSGEYEGNYQIDSITWQLNSGSFEYDIKAHKYDVIDYFTLDSSVLDGEDVLA